MHQREPHHGKWKWKGFSALTLADIPFGCLACLLSSCVQRAAAGPSVRLSFLLPRLDFPVSLPFRSPSLALQEGGEPGCTPPLPSPPPSQAQAVLRVRALWGGARVSNAAAAAGCGVAAGGTPDFHFPRLPAQWGSGNLTATGSPRGSGVSDAPARPLPVPSVPLQSGNPHPQRWPRGKGAGGGGAGGLAAAASAPRPSQTCPQGLSPPWAPGRGPQMTAPAWSAVFREGMESAVLVGCDLPCFFSTRPPTRPCGAALDPEEGDLELPQTPQCREDPSDWWCVRACWGTAAHRLGPPHPRPSWPSAGARRHLPASPRHRTGLPPPQSQGRTVEGKEPRRPRRSGVTPGGAARESRRGLSATARLARTSTLPPSPGLADPSGWGAERCLSTFPTSMPGAPHP